MADFGIDREFEAKLTQELAQGRPYEAFQFAQSYLARKFTPATAQLVCKRLLEAVAIFAKLNSGTQGGHLLLWYLEQKAYIAELNAEEFSQALKTIGETLQNGDPEQCGQLAEVVSAKVAEVSLRAAAPGGGGRASPEAAAGVVCALGEALGRAGKWEQATQMFLKGRDMERLSVSLHNWASSGIRGEYPLYFARMALGLLNSDRVGDCAGLIQHSDAFMKEYKSSVLPNETAATWSLAAWHFSVMLCDIVSLGSAVSVKEKVDLYALLREKYIPVLQHPDPGLAVLADKISASYKINKIASKPAGPSKTTGGGGGLASFAPMLRRHFSAK